MNRDKELDKWINRVVLGKEHGMVRNYSGHLPSALQILEKMDVPWHLEYDGKMYSAIVAGIDKDVKDKEDVPLAICQLIFKHWTDKDWICGNHA